MHNVLKLRATISWHNCCITVTIKESNGCIQCIYMFRNLYKVVSCYVHVHICVCVCVWWRVLDSVSTCSSKVHAYKPHYNQPRVSIHLGPHNRPWDKWWLHKFLAVLGLRPLLLWCQAWAIGWLCTEEKKQEMSFSMCRSTDYLWMWGWYVTILTPVFMEQVHLSGISEGSRQSFSCRHFWQSGFSHCTHTGP